MDLLTKIFKNLKLSYKNQIFYPKFWSIIFNPVYLCRRRLANEIKTYSHYMKGKLLDFGCGTKPYRNLFSVEEYIGVEYNETLHSFDNDEIEYYYNGKTLPFDDNAFDSIFSSEVFEHVFNLEDIICELNRVLKENGCMLITLPFMFEEHEVPQDFARYTSYGITHLLEINGFKVVHFSKIPNFIESIFQIFLHYLANTILPSNIYFRLVLAPFIVFPLNVIALFLSKIMPEYDKYYINSVIVAVKN